jgi:hypothetical protein
MIRIPHCLDKRLTDNCEILKERKKERKEIWGGGVAKVITMEVGGKK